MLTNTSFQTSNVDSCILPARVRDALMNVRQEWELVAEGESLLHYKGSVGLLLFDIVTKLDISDEERRSLLGSALYDAVMNFVTRQG